MNTSVWDIYLKRSDRWVSVSLLALVSAKCKLFLWSWSCFTELPLLPESVIDKPSWLAQNCPSFTTLPELEFCDNASNALPRKV